MAAPELTEVSTTLHAVLRVDAAGKFWLERHRARLPVKPLVDPGAAEVLEGQSITWRQFREHARLVAVPKLNPRGKLAQKLAARLSA